MQTTCSDGSGGHNGDTRHGIRRRMRIPSHIRWIALIGFLAILPLLLIITFMLLYTTGTVPELSSPQRHPGLYAKIGATPPASGYVWIYSDGFADVVTYYRLPLEGLPDEALQNAPKLEQRDIPYSRAWWWAPKADGTSRRLTFNADPQTLEFIWSPEQDVVFVYYSPTR